MSLAQQAEQSGWDGFFLWDHVNVPARMIDATIALTAIAATTRTLRLGMMITAPARRRPWKLAREMTALDHVSNGRAVLGVGLGESDHDFAHVNEATDAKVRAQRTDEALTVMDGLWRGETVNFDGDHFQVRDLRFSPRPVQQPRIPVWVAGWYPNRPPMRRAARWDGMYPLGRGKPLSVDDWRDILGYINQHRPDPDAPFDAVHAGITPNDPAEAGAMVAPYAKVGVTWWFEVISPERVGWKLGGDWSEPWDVDAITERIAHGPPRLHPV